MTITKSTENTEVEGSALTASAAVDGKAPETKEVQTSGQDAGGALTGDEKKVELTGDAKVAADKAAADKAIADKAEADKIDVKFGELEVDPKFADKFKGVAKDLGLDSAKAQKVADLYVEARAEEEAATRLALEQQDKQWIEALRKDKEIGGAEHSKHVIFARKALSKFGTPELTKLINGYGLSNHPELVRVFARIGKADAEDSVGDPGGAPAVTLTEAERLAQRYPKSIDAMTRG